MVAQAVRKDLAPAYAAVFGLGSRSAPGSMVAAAAAVAVIGSKTTTPADRHNRTQSGAAGRQQAMAAAAPVQVELAIALVQQL